MIKKLGSIAPCVLLIRAFITVMDLSEEVHTQVLASLNINIVCPFVNLVDVFDSHLSVTSPVELVFALVSS